MHKIATWALFIAACAMPVVPVLQQTQEAGVAPPQQVRVVLQDASGRQVGEAVLTQKPEGLHVKVEARGLTPGYHGFHIHEQGVCEAPTFESAGAHFNPSGANHGFLNAHGPHAGDFPNLLADANGTASGEWVTQRVTLKKGEPHSLLRNGGTALIIHSGSDDYLTDPAGNAGARAACGVIAD